MCIGTVEQNLHFFLTNEDIIYYCLQNFALRHQYSIWYMYCHVLILLICHDRVRLNTSSSPVSVAERFDLAKSVVMRWVYQLNIYIITCPWRGYPTAVNHSSGPCQYISVPSNAWARYRYFVTNAIKWYFWWAHILFTSSAIHSIKHVYLIAGLFLRLQSRTAKDHTCHRSIESLARHGVKAFLNLTKLTAFQIGRNHTTTEYVKIDYTSGNVFLIDKVFQGSARVRTESKVLHMKSNSIQHIQYLKCKDEKDVDILIPMSQPGEFIEALPSPLGNGRLSVNAESLIATQKFPIVVRFISGRNRPRLTSFSGLFTLLDSFEETTLFGCILDSHGFTMLEVPLSSPLTFQLALNTADLYSHPVVKKALRLCDLKAQVFFRELKYKFKFAQRIMQKSGRRMTPIDDDENDPGDPPSAANSARFGVTTTYIYL